VELSVLGRVPVKLAEGILPQGDAAGVRVDVVDFAYDQGGSIEQMQGLVLGNARTRLTR
jgi:hypothetical protein